MKIVRAPKSNGNYTSMSNVFLKDNRLSLKEKGLLALILTFNENTWNFTLNGLMAFCPDKKDAIRSTVNDLISHGYCIERKQIATEIPGKFIGGDYTFTDDLKQLVRVGFSVAENPVAENPQHIITNSNNNQLNNKNKTKKVFIDFEGLYNGYKAEILNDSELLSSLEEQTEYTFDNIFDILNEKVNEYIVLKDEVSFIKFKRHFRSTVLKKEKVTKENGGSSGRAMSL